MFFFDPTYMLIMLFAIGLGAATQAYIRSAYRRWSEVPLATNKTGAEVARAMLNEAGLSDVEIRPTGGQLTDNYDPRSRTLNLSQGVYDGRSVAAAGVASHEAGHAVQHARAFAPAAVRSALVPAANLGSQLAWPMILFGFWFRFSGLVTLGIVFFGAAVLFQVVTLPVEFDASRRAMASIRGNMMIPPEQAAGARSVLTAAALTYIAATLISIVQLLYLLSRRR
jgi:Zn-dependent membrane protease YugP